MKKYLITLLSFISLSANAANAADLTVYTYDSFVSEWGPGPQLEKAFEAQCQCDLEFIVAEDGVSILNRLRIEQDRTKADIILGIDDALIEIARREQLVQPHGMELSQITSDLQWQDHDFVPFDYGYFAFIYNSEKITTPVSSLKELVDSKATVIYQDPRTSTPGQGLMLWVKAVYGDQSTEAWQQLSSHTLTVTKGWWEAYSLFLQGDADYVLSYNTSPAYHVVAEKKSQYKAALFSEGHVAQIEVAAITRSSKQPERAREFLTFLVSAEAQAIIPTSNWMLPVVDDVVLPPVFDQLISPQRIGFSPIEIADQRAGWIREWRSAASR